MRIKRKLATGALSACVGISLIGTGTWAAVNDVEKQTAEFAAGKLDFEIQPINLGEHRIPYTFEVSNLKPGDSMYRAFTIDNVGSLAIKEVLLDTIASNFKNGNNEFVEQLGSDNDVDEFLDQYQVNVLWVTSRSLIDLDPDVIQEFYDDHFSIINSEDEITLKDLKYNDFPSDVVTGSDGRISIAPNNEGGLFIDRDKFDGLPVTPDDKEAVLIGITMKDDKNRKSEGPAKGEFLQNQFMGDSVDITFSFEGTQWEGIEVSEEGYIKENEKAHSGDY
ncbi:biofilm matrix protein TasA [Salinibacillus aidingensis]|uniref:Biofilm matrix protein TasA n=1 Tax=Salinibacillus aidingensis TaxID=237684 RepID=A0ABN1B3G9_9BACI